MKLFLASEAKHPTTIEHIRNFVGGFEGKKIAYIPTAGNGEDPYGTWKKNAKTWKLVKKLGAKITPVVLEEYKNDTVLKEFENKDVLWFAGGATGYLMYWVRRCSLHVHIRRILETGTVFVGSSAGAMITGPSLEYVEWYIGENETGAGVIPGLGLVDFSIYPHYEDALLPEIKKHYGKDRSRPVPTLFLLKNGESITVVDGKITVLGEKRVLL